MEQVPKNRNYFPNPENKKQGRWAADPAGDVVKRGQKQASGNRTQGVVMLGSIAAFIAFIEPTFVKC